MKSFRHTYLLSGLLFFQPALTAVVMFLLLAGSELASAQPDTRNNQYSYGGSPSPVMAVVVVVVIAILFFMGFFTVYLRRYTGAVDGSVHPRAAEAMRVANGLDASMIETFPTLVYSEVKTRKIGRGALECAVCLNEFEDDETLRLLPKCDHVFHPHCIGAWLHGHVTCPVCRTNLAEPDVITETDIESQQSVVPEPAVELGGSVKFSRSHTTGHFVECTDRFTLRLPEDLRRKIMENWKINRSNSLLVLPRSGKPVDWLRARSDRWLFRKTKSFMWRSQDDGSVRTNAVKSPTGDSVRADRWNFYRNPSFLCRNTPVPSPRVEVQCTGTGGSIRLPV